RRKKPLGRPHTDAPCSIPLPASHNKPPDRPLLSDHPRQAKYSRATDRRAAATAVVLESVPASVGQAVLTRRDPRRLRFASSAARPKSAGRDTCRKTRVHRLSRDYTAAATLDNYRDQSRILNGYADVIDQSRGPAPPSQADHAARCPNPQRQ